MLKFILAGAAVTLLVVIVIAYEYGKSTVINELIADSRRGDVAAAAARFDWPELRAYMKQNMVEVRKATAMFGDVGPSESQIPAVVDYYVQPENIGIAFYLHTEMFPQVKEEDFIDSTGYAFPLGFEMTLGVPKSISSDEIPQALRDKAKVRIVFRLDGLTWKVKEMHVPPFMVPTTVYDTPAIKIYGPPKTP